MAGNDDFKKKVSKQKIILYDSYIDDSYSTNVNKSVWSMNQPTIMHRSDIQMDVNIGQYLKFKNYHKKEYELDEFKI